MSNIKIGDPGLIISTRYPENSHLVGCVIIVIDLLKPGIPYTDPNGQEFLSDTECYIVKFSEPKKFFAPGHPDRFSDETLFAKHRIIPLKGDEDFTQEVKKEELVCS